MRPCDSARPLMSDCVASTLSAICPMITSYVMAAPPASRLHLRPRRPLRHAVRRDTLAGLIVDAVVIPVRVSLPGAIDVALRAQAPPARLRGRVAFVQVPAGAPFLPIAVILARGARLDDGFVARG